MNTLSSQGGHSALVKMQLRINGSCLHISHMGPDFLFVDATAAPALPAPTVRFNRSPGQRPGNGPHKSPSPERGESKPAPRLARL
jgi:hypothetical protein